jgi:hypothetical protein
MNAQDKTIVIGAIIFSAISLFILSIEISIIGNIVIVFFGWGVLSEMKNQEGENLVRTAFIIALISLIYNVWLSI